MFSLNLLTTATAVIATATTATTTDQSVQSVFGLITVLLGGSSVIGIAINRIFDTRNIKVIVELQGEIKSLQREAKYRENDLNRIEVENAGLREQVSTLQEQCNSSINTQLIDLQKQYQSLLSEHKKAVTIINRYKKGITTNDTNH